MSKTEERVKEITEHYEEDGVCYGVSGENNIISIDRRKNANSSGWLLGATGSGKTFLAKKEIESVILKYQDDVVIIDQEGEYEKLTEKYNGENIKLSLKSAVKINPFDIPSDLERLTSEFNNIISFKKEFLAIFIEVLAKGLSKTESNIVYKILTKLYDEYIENLKEGHIIKPTFLKFYEELLYQNEKEAQEIATRIEVYVKGSLNLFAGETNLNTNSKITNFNLQELTGDLKTAAYLYLCEFIYQKMDINREMAKYTWIYIDEISTYLTNEDVVYFFYKFYRYCRPYGGIPTLISQNIEDLLKYEYIRLILTNTEFLCLLRQDVNEREALKNLFGLSEVQIDFVRDNKIGTGVILIEGNKLLKFKMESWLQVYCNTNIEKIKKEYDKIYQFLENQVEWDAAGWMKAQLTHFEAFEGEITFEKINIFPDLMKRALEHKELIHYIIEKNIDYKEIEVELKNVDTFLTTIYENSPFFKENGFRSRREVYEEVKEKYKKLA